MSLRPPRITARDLVDEPAPAAPATPAPGAVAPSFDYTALEVEHRIVAQQRASEIRTLIRRTTQDIIEIGQKLIDVKGRLPRGQFDAWAKGELGFERATAYRFIAVAEQFGESSQIETIGASALYLLASASTPDAAREEALERAAAGETITHQTAQQIVARHKPAPEPAPDLTITDGVVAELAPRAEALGLQLTKGLAGYVLQGPELEPAIFMGRYGLEGYLSQREREAAKKAAATPPSPVPPAEVPGDTDPLGKLDYLQDDLLAAGWKAVGWVPRAGGAGEYIIVLPDGSRATYGLYALMTALEAAPGTVLTKAGWRRRPGSALAWVAPGTDARGQLTELEFDDHAELAAAAAIITAEPTISYTELCERLALPPADNPIPADIRVLADAYGLLTRPSPGGQFWLYWPGEEDQVGEGAEQLAPLDDISAREWLLWDAARLAKERAPQSLYCRALAAGYDIRGANSQTGQLLASVPGKDPDDVEAFAPADLEARLRQGAAELAAPQLATPPAPESTPLSHAEQRTIELSAEQVTASRGNPAWAAGSDLAGDLAWEVIEALGAEGKDREITRALHTARQLVAALEREAGVEHDYTVPMVYRRLSDFEATPGVLGRVALQDLDDVLSALEGLAGTLDDVSYENLAARLSAVKARKAAA